MANHKLLIVNLSFFLTTFRAFSIPSLSMASLFPGSFIYETMSKFYNDKFLIQQWKNSLTINGISFPDIEMQRDGLIGDF